MRNGLHAKFLFPALMCLFTLSMTSHAGTLYTTLGPGDSFDSGPSWGIGGIVVPQVIGTPFSLGTSATVTDALLAVSSPDGGAMNVYIESDSSGSPGSILASFSSLNPVPVSAAGVQTFNCLTGCSLSAGSYWLVALDPTAATLGSWYEAYNDPSGTVAISNSNTGTGPWFVVSGNQGGFIPAYEIDGNTSATPEPASMLLTGAAFVALGFVRRRKRA